MRSGFVVMMLCLLLIPLLGCIPKEYLYVEVIVNDRSSPPVFRFSGDKKFKKPAERFRGITVYSDSPDRTLPRKFYWSISTWDGSHNLGSAMRRVSIREIVYGIVPEGFKEWEKLLPLEPDAEYGLEIGRSFIHMDMIFSYKPGIYSGYGSSYGDRKYGYQEIR
ncbi:hypothetical protein JW766_02240 [Candidatus Dojkabacteria bacterium]|nr:hypothetical protein [Candidatus Dojkabacteria bacterium]